MKKILSFAAVAGVAALATAAASVDASARAQRVQTHDAECSHLPADFQQQVALAACFAPDTPLEVVQAVGESIYGLGQRFNTGSRWPGPSVTAVTLTYSFPPDGIFLPAQFQGDSSGNNEIHARMNQLFNGATSQWKGLIRQCFDAWENVTGNTYIEEPNDDGAAWPGSGGIGGVRGDIRIVMRNIDGGSGTLAFNFFPSTGDMLLDRSENWTSSGGNFRFMRNIVMHEHGHGLGLFHTCPQFGQKLMEPGINTNFDGPQLDDIRGAHSLYGDRFEPNASAATAVDLASMGLVPNNPFSISTLSMHASGDQDFFAVPSTGGVTVSATVTPTGFTYNEAPQAGNGSCPTGSNTVALEQQNLVLEVIGPDGGTVLASANVNGFGGSETLTDVNLSNVADYYVRVRSAGGTSVQTYNITITLG
ncbi:MAG: matrixin family metalloprotease, partial [Planctomycetota bacterium]|nr:matrixin family metalloprotease [Planctomycetota bacterium]